MAFSFYTIIKKDGTPAKLYVCKTLAKAGGGNLFCGWLQ